MMNSVFFRVRIGQKTDFSRDNTNLLRQLCAQHFARVVIAPGNLELPALDDTAYLVHRDDLPVKYDRDPAAQVGFRELLKSTGILLRKRNAQQGMTMTIHLCIRRSF